MADSQLAGFAKHCRRMAATKHTDECIDHHRELARRIRMAQVFGPGWGEPDELPDPCPGCVTDADRQLWTRLADEIDAYLAGELEEHVPDPDQPTLMEAPE